MFYFKVLKLMKVISLEKNIKWEMFIKMMYNITTFI